MCRTCQAYQRSSNWQVVLFYILMDKELNKSFLSIDEHLKLLKDRGLTFEEPYAKKQLSRISYFRLSAYFYPLLDLPKDKHQFKRNATFAQAMDMYKFDRKLRLFIFSQIEKIEIFIRLKIVEIGFVETQSISWLLEEEHFRDISQFNKTRDLLLKEWNTSKEDFVVSFKDKYGEATIPPAYMLIELAPLGVVSHLFRNIKKNKLQKKIAKEFGLPPNVLASWIFSLSGIRNICCHHNRLWNRSLPTTPMILNKPQAPWIEDRQVDCRRTYYKIAMIKYLLYFINPNNKFMENLLALHKIYPQVDFLAMGFPKDWQKDNFWK